MSLPLENTSFRTHLPVFHWSGIYQVLGLWDWYSVTGTGEDVRDNRVSFGPAHFYYYYPGNRSDYYVCRFGYFDLDSPSGSRFLDEDSGWIEVWVWTGTATDSPVAYVYDSDGNSYDVDLAIDGYVISGPSLD